MAIPNDGNQKEVGIMATPQERKPLTPGHIRSCLSSSRENRGDLSSAAGADRLDPNSVTFAERCKVRLFRPNMKEDNLNAWYSVQDINRFKKECVRTLRVILNRHNQLKAAGSEQQRLLQETTSPLDVSEKMMLDKNETWTGLDCFLPCRTKVRTNRRLVTRELVLECSQHQEEVERTTDSRAPWNPAWTAQQCSSVAEASASDARRAALVLVNQLADSRTTGDENRTCPRKTTNKGESKKKVVARAMSLPIRPALAALSRSRPFVDKAEKRLVISPMA